jgi:hypothetical protein
MLVGVNKPTPEFTELLTRCVLGGFGSFTCASLGILVFLPVVEILIGRHRTHSLRPFYLLELDNTPALPAEGTIELKV